jgi:hypothetical protein
MTEDERFIWRTLAILEKADKSVFFHGHTHVQTAWGWEPDGRLREVRDTTFKLEAKHRYVVGVGSAGLPEDGCWAAYTLYDEDLSQVEQRCLKRTMSFQ